MNMETGNTTVQTSCKQCGICCAKGGAALHSGDLSLLRDKNILLSDLITIRKGEFAYNPVTDTVQATQNEIVKLRGSGREWTCCYYDVNSCGCTIYDHRPLACHALKCWDPDDSLALVESDLLSRNEILADNESMQRLVREFEAACPLPDFAYLFQKMKNVSTDNIVTLEQSVNSDLEFRDRVVKESAEVSREEMFLFGRPLFQLLQSFGFDVFQSGSHLRLHLQAP
ncbi:MAG TPA: YkgJ family cysteine cluster protein [Desulfocapsa sulfexigens]|nr:YkgJ family cysteine cluster protein [Desulfocapsa sulfexigens]